MQPPMHLCRSSMVFFESSQQDAQHLKDCAYDCEKKYQTKVRREVVGISDPQELTCTFRRCELSISVSIPFTASSTFFCAISISLAIPKRSPQTEQIEKMSKHQGPNLVVLRKRRTFFRLRRTPYRIDGEMATP
jgi:hypothetical protein